MGNFLMSASIFTYSQHCYIFQANVNFCRENFFFPPAKESYLSGGRPRAISADKLHKFLKRVLARVVVVSDGWVGKVRARLLDDGGRWEVQGRSRRTRTPCQKRHGWYQSSGEPGNTREGERKDTKPNTSLQTETRCSRRLGGKEKKKTDSSNPVLKMPNMREKLFFLRKADLKHLRPSVKVALVELHTALRGDLSTVHLNLRHFLRPRRQHRLSG